MDKLFIIGNGFDLAHGYPTAYCDFVKWLWNNIHKDPTNIKFHKLIKLNTEISFLREYNQNLNTNINCYNDFLKDFDAFKNSNNQVNSFELSATYRRIEIFKFENKFFYELCIYFPDAKWSDIESLFYKILTDLSNGIKPSNSRIDIDKLNSDMEVIKEFFSEYLLECVIYKDLNFEMPFPELLRFKSKNLDNLILSKDGSNYLNEFPSEMKDRLITTDQLIQEAEDFESWSVNGIKPCTLILDFNYTDTINQYINNAINRNSFEYGEITHIKIHGNLNDKNNPINLGFGDEMDDQYKKLENMNDNRYLKYIKSFMYSNNSNYRKLLNWIDTYDFQVYILGHSCGLSDRIMLNTIFEHPNCHSIKVYYYQWEENGIIKDDFTDKIQNISRHFNKKKQMREKLVDKSISKPLMV